jgi:hypothetical protein
MELKMKYSWFIIIFIILSCSEDQIIDSESESKSDVSDQSVPGSILFKSNNFIISYVGREFFNAYISYDHAHYYDADSFCIENPENCAPFLQYPHYLIVYKFSIPEKPYVNEIVEFVVDTSGNVVPDREPFGLPNCPRNTCWGNFPIIDEEEAIQIARDAGLEDGIREWRTSFHFFAGDIDDYVWSVSNTLNENNGSSGGKTLTINSHTGEILKISSWQAIP